MKSTKSRKNLVKEVRVKQIRTNHSNDTKLKFTIDAAVEDLKEEIKALKINNELNLPNLSRLSIDTLHTLHSIYSSLAESIAKIIMDRHENNGKI